MPGICGLAIHLPEPDANVAEHLDRMLETMRHEPWYRVSRYVDADKGVGLGVVSLGHNGCLPNGKPGPVAVDGAFTVCDPDLFDREQRNPGVSPGDLLRRGYAKSGSRFFRDVSGSFSCAFFDDQSDRLILANDCFGMKPLYYAHEGGMLIFATSIRSVVRLLGYEPTINRRGLAQFFTYGQLLGDDTLVEGVRCLPAGSCLVYDRRRDRFHIDRYWNWSEFSGHQVSDGAALEEIDYHLERAILRQTATKQRLGISLSGGLDARTILALIDPERTAVTTVCMGMEGSIDLQSARRLSQLAHQPHHSHILDEKFLSQFRRHLYRMVQLTDGHYLSQCIVMPTLPLYRELGIDVLLRGHAGELLHMTKAYNFSLDRAALDCHDAAGLEAWLQRRLRAHVADPKQVSVFGPENGPEMDALARESLHECYEQSAAVEPLLHRVWQMFIAQRLRRETAMSMMKFGSVAEVRLPYLDKDVVAALFRARPSLKLSETIQAFILRRHRPDFLAVANANTGARVGAGKLARTLAYGKLKLFAKLGVRGYQPYERLGLWLRRELRRDVEELVLSDRALDRGLFHADSVRRIVQDHFDNRRNHTFLLLALLVFEAGQRLLSQTEQPGSVLAGCKSG